MAIEVTLFKDGAVFDSVLDDGLGSLAMPFTRLLVKKWRWRNRKSDENAATFDGHLWCWINPIRAIFTQRNMATFAS